MRWIMALCLMAIGSVLVGCNAGVKELGPATDHKAGQPDPEEMKKAMQENMKMNADMMKKMGGYGMKPDAFTKGATSEDANKKQNEAAGKKK